jgi:drug/metabolite transporter (DMT)-like permease
LEPWIAITIAAAFFQNLRSALQRYLTGRLSADGAAYVRFLYAIPFAAVYLVGLHTVTGERVPAPNLAFAAWGGAGGTAQIVATLLLLRAFTVGSFAIGTAYSKTDTVQAALFSALLLGEHMNSLALVGILVSLVGVVLLARPMREAHGSARALFASKGAWLGIASGGAFALSAVCYRAAALALEGHSSAMQASFTLAMVVVFQAFTMGVYLRWRDRSELGRVVRAWRPALLVGGCGMIASACWFTAIALVNAAYVRAVGQVELVFTFIASIVVFRERVTPFEVIGVLLIVGGIVLLLAR